jgi:hypothetical protein
MSKTNASNAALLNGATRSNSGVKSAAAKDVPSDDALDIALDGQTRAKLVLFAVPADERVDGGPDMRGLLEVDAGRISAAAWKRVARDTGTEYLSLKVGNTRPRGEGEPADAPQEWTVGPFYGRLFKAESQARGVQRKRYFGFIEDAEKVGEDTRSHKSIYKTHWQLQIKAHPSVSNDGRTHYIDGTVSPAGAKASAEGEQLPF